MPYVYYIYIYCPGQYAIHQKIFDSNPSNPLVRDISVGDLTILLLIIFVIFSKDILILRDAFL